MASDPVLGSRRLWRLRKGLLAALLLAGILAQGCSDNNGRVTGAKAKVTGDAVGSAIKVSVTISPGVIDVGRRASVLVIVSSPNGFPLVGRKVDLSSTGGSLDATTGITDDNGRFSTTILVTCSDTGTVSVTAFADNQSQVAATATANVAAATASNSPCPAGSGVPPTTGGGGTPPLPVVSITSSGIANETGPVSATFTVSRTGSTSLPLTVSFGISGTASLSQVPTPDYTLTGTGVIVLTPTTGTVTIPGGSASVTMTLTPAETNVNDEPDDPLGPATDAERAIITLTASTGYTVGSPAVAVLEICDAGAASCP